MLLQAAINGARMAHEHPLLPLSATQAAQESLECVSAGADAIHVHVYNANGQESLHPDDVAAYLKAIRSSCPNTPIGISTGAWIAPDLEERQQLIEGWQVLPDFVSLNLDEVGYEQVAGVLLRKGIGIEAGLSTEATAQSFCAWKDHPRCLRILLEPADATVDAANITVANMETILEKKAPNLPRLLHGIDHTAWPLIQKAIQRGYATRIGLEDTLMLPDGRKAKNNAQLLIAVQMKRMNDGMMD